ncbi:type IV pilus biogenesis protein PilM [Escherichia coli]|nr:type IV pilus biogenesis protein PilM [Escherichia coli]
MPEQPGLVETLRSKSRGSALIGIFQNGQLTWLSGTATGLTPPAGITALVLSSTLTNLDIFMKNSHQRSMKLAVLPCMIAVALSISGCTLSEINKMSESTKSNAQRYPLPKVRYRLNNQ